MKNHVTEAADSEPRCTWPGLGPGEYFAENGEFKKDVFSSKRLFSPSHFLIISPPGRRPARRTLRVCSRSPCRCPWRYTRH